MATRIAAFVVAITLVAFAAYGATIGDAPDIAVCAAVAAAVATVTAAATKPRR